MYIPDFWQDVKSNWANARNSIKEEWDELTDQEINQLTGNYVQLVHEIQAAYEVTAEDASEQIESWYNNVKEQMQRVR